jgi:hypothetical protein
MLCRAGRARNPRHAQAEVISDDRMAIVAREIVKRLKATSITHGQIKVHVVRETTGYRIRKISPDRRYLPNQQPAASSRL